MLEVEPSASLQMTLRLPLIVPERILSRSAGPVGTGVTGWKNKGEDERGGRKGEPTRRGLYRSSTNQQESHGSGGRATQMARDNKASQEIVGRVACGDG